MGGEYLRVSEEIRRLDSSQSKATSKIDAFVQQLVEKGELKDFLEVEPIYIHDHFKIDRICRQIEINGSHANFTKTEFDFADFLSRNEGIPQTSESIHRFLWNINPEGWISPSAHKAVKTVVCRTRSRFREYGIDGLSLIKTQKNNGYFMVVPTKK